jgi:type I restriction enzyme, S subunit
LQRGFDLPSADRTVGPYPVVAASGVHSYHDEFRVKGPGVVTGRSGTIGKFMFVEGDFWPLNTALWVKDFKIGGAIYAFYVLSSLELNTSNSGSAVPSLNRNIVHLLPYLIPSPQVVEAFEMQVGPIRQQISKLVESTNALRAARDLLLPRLISGEIDVSRAEADGLPDHAPELLAAAE